MFLENRHEVELQQFYNNVTLRPWQEKMLNVIDNCDSPRQIIWMIDPVGNNGKTFLSYYMRDMFQAIRVPNVNSNDLRLLIGTKKLSCLTIRENRKMSSTMICWRI